jgi:DNA-binding transcriptional regulator YdaS (Cro superfamily)
MRIKNIRLLDWLKTASDQAIAGTGTTRSYLKAIAYGYKTAGPEIAVSIEFATDRAVIRQDLREDWVMIWPELQKKSVA